MLGMIWAEIQPENPSLGRVAGFLMGKANHDGDRKRSDVKRKPHKTSPPFGDDSQPLFPLHWRLLPLSGDPNCVGLSMILQNPTISVNGFSTGA